MWLKYISEFLLIYVAVMFGYILGYSRGRYGGRDDK